MVRDYLERSRQPVAQPDAPEVDVRAAADSDARRNFGGAMLAAGQAFTGNRRAVAQLPSSNAQEAQALGQQDARRRALAEWAQAQERQRLGETGLLGQAMSADEAAKARADSLGVQRDRLELDKEKADTAAEDKDLDRDAKTAGRAAAAAKAAEKARLAAEKQGKKDAEGLAAGFELDPSSNSTKKQREDHAGLVAAAKRMKGLTAQMRQALQGLDVVDRLNPLGAKRNALKQLATMTQIEAKNVAMLGALSGPDFALMQAIAADPTSLQSLTKDQTSVLDQLDAWGENSAKAAAENIGAKPKASATPDVTPPKGKVPMISEASGNTIFVTPATAEAGLKAKTLRKP
jgi:hypothetical protein